MTQDASPDSDDYFNQPMEEDTAQSTSQDNKAKAGNNESVPRPKRIACILCRKRKLKCCGTKPACATCSRLGHKCEYNEERKKSGPKRGYVKLLEARLKQVENLLETRDTQSKDASPSNLPEKVDANTCTMPTDTSIPMDPIMPTMNIDPAFDDPTLIGGGPFHFGGSDDFSWEMIGLGLEEALPSQEAIDELNQIYFEKIHPSLPMIHKARFLASMDLAPHMRPAVCLRYAMWTHAASITPKYHAFAEHFYQRARKYAEQDEMKGHGESIITVGHCQAWTLLACYEFKLIYFPRAWMSIGRASRLALMMGLHRQDRVGLDVKQTLPPPRDWTDREERRRTFWMAFCQDRYASIGTGWPMVMDEQDILTNLPASEDAFNRSKPEQTGQLSDILNGLGTDTISSFSGVILLATLYGRNLTHLHRPNDDDNDHDLSGAFWRRHRQLDNILLNISLSMPAAIRLPAAMSDANAIFVNMNIHTAAICLHQAAIFKADKHRLPAQISAESKRRCIVAADQITNIMKMISHIDLSLMNPFLAFCLYVAARVFVQYLKSRKDDQTVMSALNFLLSAMQALKVKNPLTESFLVQLDVDLEGSGLNIPSQQQYPGGHKPPGEIPANTDAVHCLPLYEIRESQTVGQTGREHGGQSTDPNFHQPWPETANRNDTTNYPELNGTYQSQMPNQTNQRQTTGSYRNDDLLHAQQSSTGSGPSPNFSGSSHSGQPTPSTSSLPYNEFSPSNQPFMQPGAPGAFDGQNASWSMPSRPGNGSTPLSNPAAGLQQPQQKASHANDFDFGRTGWTPGATGMTPLPEEMWPNGDAGNWSQSWST